MSGAQLYLKDTWPLITTGEKEMVISMALLGAVFGTMIGGPLSDSFGRRPVVLAASIIYTVGATIVACSQSLPILMMGRFIIGLELGIDSTATPVYLSEVAPIQIRGGVITVSIIAEILGAVVSGGVVLIC
jgi:MFS family permease